jgi:hypothetical protein
MDMSLIQHKELRLALAQGLNHIPLKPTSIAHAVATIMGAARFWDLNSSSFLYRMLEIIYTVNAWPL